ncbi:hypothetical protein PoB_000325200 [Plakobranchus ocellatus]|uniref:Uncharacterized protein n=1 Tax=Plakobranchus ocellatus TaxID=259542 RepID=A0AAV3Y3U5_9GAST|nr:hypothetical protein PoB_000325200 [Plakobranchus ocellatus]
MQSLSSVRRRIHHHRHVRILMAFRSFHIPNDHIADGVRDAQRFHFTTQVTRPQVDHCLLSQLRCRSQSTGSSHQSTDSPRPVPCAHNTFKPGVPHHVDSSIAYLQDSTRKSLVLFNFSSAALVHLFRLPAEAFYPLLQSGGCPSHPEQDQCSL